MVIPVQKQPSGLISSLKFGIYEENTVLYVYSLKTVIVIHIRHCTAMCITLAVSGT